MTAILTVYSRHKRHCVGRCDANCYNAPLPSESKARQYATKPQCSCICGGKNHSAGLTKAIRNQDLIVPILPIFLNRWADERGLNPDDLCVIDRLTVRDKAQARRIADGAFTPPAPLPLFECQALAGSEAHLTRPAQGEPTRDALPTDSSSADPTS